MSLSRSLLRVPSYLKSVNIRCLQTTPYRIQKEDPDEIIDKIHSDKHVTARKIPDQVVKVKTVGMVIQKPIREKPEDPPFETDYRERNAEDKYMCEPNEIIKVDINWFGDEGAKDKEAFLDKCENFQKTVTKHRHGQVEFIYAALRHMKDFGVHKDLQAYKGLMDVLPKEVMVPTNIFQAMFWHFHKQQVCAVEILHKMELMGVEPDAEMERLVIDIFGQNSIVWRKVARQLYWFSKFRNVNPYPLPEDITDLGALELAKLALERMCPDLQTKISVFDTNQLEYSVDKTWIVSAQSPTQRELINEIFVDQPLYVEGPHTVWVKDQQITFFMLRADNRVKDNPEEVEPDPLDVTNIPLHPHGQSKEGALMKQKNIHTQEDGTILSLAATGTSSRDSLLSWIRLLQKSNPKLKQLQVIFTLKAPNFQVQSFQERQKQQNNEGSSSTTDSSSTSMS